MNAEERLQFQHDMGQHEYEVDADCPACVEADRLAEEEGDESIFGVLLPVSMTRNTILLRANWAVNVIHHGYLPTDLREVTWKKVASRNYPGLHLVMATGPVRKTG